MDSSVEYVSSHLFVFGFHGKLSSNRYFYCVNKCCPYSLLMEVSCVSGSFIATRCAFVIFPVHNHEKNEQYKAQKRKEIADQLRFIQLNPNHPRSFELRNQHAIWNRDARKESKLYREHLLDIEAIKVYELDHPEKSAKQLKIDCCVSLNTRSICNIILREKEKKGQTFDLEGMVKHKAHHVLGNDGNDIVVFGRSSALRLL